MLLKHSITKGNNFPFPEKISFFIPFLILVRTNLIITVNFSAVQLCPFSYPGGIVLKLWDRDSLTRIRNALTKLPANR